jgi:hypothetical protein
MARQKTISVTSRADSAKTTNVVLARRLASGRLNGSGNRDLPLKEPKRWYTRLDNTLADEQMFYRMTQEMGYQPLTAEDLSCTPEEAGFRVNELGHLVKGARGEEMAFKMSWEDRRQLEAAMTDANMKGIGSASKVKRDMVEAAGSQMGSEAAEYLDSLDGSVSDVVQG